ncbi:MAG TPA: hypothetical protein VGM03_14810 [Phycisphaerae bacterium]
MADKLSARTVSKKLRKCDKDHKNDEIAARRIPIGLGATRTRVQTAAGYEFVELFPKAEDDTCSSRAD